MCVQVQAGALWELLVHREPGLGVEEEEGGDQGVQPLWLRWIQVLLGH